MITNNNRTKKINSSKSQRVLKEPLDADIVYLRGFEVVRKERTEKAVGGVAIYINKELKYSRKHCMMVTE
jgi:hypothetical protein